MNNFAEIKLYNDYVYDSKLRDLYIRNDSPLGKGGLITFFDGKNAKNRQVLKEILMTSQYFPDVMYGYADLSDVISGNTILKQYIDATKFPLISWYDGSTHKMYNFDKSNPTKDFKDLFEFIASRSGKKFRLAIKEIKGKKDDKSKQTIVAPSADDNMNLMYAHPSKYGGK